MLQNIQTADFEVVAALAGLSKLQLCSLDLHVLRDDTAPPLPAGPWLASLSRLHYNVGGLISSTAVLQNAAALEFLSAGNSRFAKLIDWYSRATIAFFDWLAEHPPLRCVFFDVTHGRLFNSGFFAAHIMQLWRHRPSLDVSAFGLRILTTNRCFELLLHVDLHCKCTLVLLSMPHFLLSPPLSTTIPPSLSRA